MGQHPAVVHRYDTRAHVREETLDAAYRQLIVCIIIQAVEDWVDLIRAEERSGKPHDEEPKPKPPTLNKNGSPRKQKPCRTRTSYDDIRSFFISEYGEDLCYAIDMEPDVILGKLENWLSVYRKSGKLPARLPVQGTHL